VAELNQALLTRAATHKLLRTHKVRADTTVVAANLAYPTDLGLLARAVDKLATTVKRVQAAGGASRTRIWDRRRQPAVAPGRSLGPCGRVLVTPNRSCSRSPGRSPTWPRPSWPTPAGSWPVPAGPLPVDGSSPPVGSGQWWRSCRPPSSGSAACSTRPRPA
jgi:hypothetical protein